MARINPDLAGLDEGDTGAPRVAGPRTDTTAISDADAKAASIAAAQSLALTPYAELTAAERATMSNAEKTAYLKAAREEQEALTAETRAASNPTFDPTNRPDAPPPESVPGSNYIYYYSWVGGSTTGEWKLYRAANTPENMATYGSRAIGGETQATFGNVVGANALTVQPQPTKDDAGNVIGFTVAGSDLDSSSTTSTTVVTTTARPVVTTTTPVVTTTGLDAATAALVKSLQDQITALTKQISGTTTANTAIAEQKAFEEKQRKENALTSLTSRFSKYGLQSLVPKIRELVINGSTESTIAFELQETEEYKQRFKANTERLKKGLAVLDAGTYIGMEDSYRQALRAYGLKQFDTDDYVSQFIANDISANELSNRIVTAVQRIQNADPAITKQLKDFYNIGQNDLVAYVLDPNQQFQKIERQVAASEIGVAAARQGLQTGVNVAEQLAAQGITQAEAQKGYATIADILPAAEKLSNIYGKTVDIYGQAEGEQEVFNSLASAQRKRQRLSAAEAATFGATSGTTRASLLSPKTTGQY